MNERMKKFSKLSKTLSKSNYPKHMIIVQADNGYELYYDNKFLNKEDLKRMFQSGMMAGLSEVLDGGE